MPNGRFAIAAALLLVLGIEQAMAKMEPVMSLADGRQGEIAFTSTTPSGPKQDPHVQSNAPSVVVRGTLLLPGGEEPCCPP